MSELSEAIAWITGRVCTRCEKNFAPRRLNGLCYDCAEVPQPEKKPEHPYWCDCELCEEEAD